MPPMSGRKNTQARLAGRKKGASIMRKTSKQGAYAKGKKKAWQNRRRPFVEKKSRDKSLISNLCTKNPQTTGFYPQPLLEHDVDADANGFHLITLEPFTRMTQGYREFEMVGDSVFSQTLQLKTELTFPQGSNVIVNPFRVYLVCGWITVPLAATPYTTKTHDQITHNDVGAHIIQQLKEFFDDSTDRLTFNENVRRNIKIEKYSRCLPKTAESTFGPSTENVTSYATSYGAPAKVERRHTWRINRKIHYTKGLESYDDNTKPASGDELIQNWYVNEQWIPFALYYMPDVDQMVRQDGVQQYCKFRHNVLHTFSDS